jgi:hypothetical protein
MALPVGPQPPPFCRGLADGGGPVTDEPGEVIERARASGFQQQVGRRRGRQRRHQASVLNEDVKALLGEVLRRHQPGHLPYRLARERVQLLEAAGADDRGDRVTRARNKPQPRAGDDGQGALRPG